MSVVDSRGGSSGRAKKASARTTAGSTAGPATTAEVLRLLPKPGIFAGMVERRFYDGIQAYFSENHERAHQMFASAAQADSRNVSDDLFAGMAAVRLDRFDEATTYLESVVSSKVALPDKLMKKFLPATLLEMQVSVAITPFVTAQAGFNNIGAALLLAEVYQKQGRLSEAIGLMKQMFDADPTNPLTRLSLCELLNEEGDHDAVIELAATTENIDQIATAILHQKGIALMSKGLLDAALETLSTCLRKTSGRDEEFLSVVRYDKAAALEAKGQHARARKELEKLFARNPNFRDVKERLEAVH